VSRDETYLRHIADSIAAIESFVACGRDAFFGQRIIYDAVIRNFEIIGEAVKRLSPDFCATQPAIPWRQIAGFRDVLIHEYFGVDLEQVWQVVVEEMPRLKAVIELAIPTAR